VPQYSLREAILVQAETVAEVEVVEAQSTFFLETHLKMMALFPLPVE
jgi:hypothetical protein